MTVHVLYHNIVDLTKRRAVLQNFPRLIRMEMNLDQILISNRQQAVPFKILRKIIADLILVQIMALDQQLCVITKFQHKSTLSFL